MEEKEVFSFDMGDPMVTPAEEEPVIGVIPEVCPEEFEKEGKGTDTPDDLEKVVIEGVPLRGTPKALAAGATRMVREGYVLSDLTNWYDWRHGKWNSRAGFSISKITVHHFAGILGKAGMERIVNDPGRQMSPNYAIYSDGSIECFCPEALRSWCSSSWENDKCAITIEVENCEIGGNWGISKEAYESLIALCADLCKRYGINPHYNGSPSGSLTLHSMFASTACPGPTLRGYITSGKLETDIRAAISGGAPAPAPKPAADQILSEGSIVTSDVFVVQKSDAYNDTVYSSVVGGWIPAADLIETDAADGRNDQILNYGAHAKFNFDTAVVRKVELWGNMWVCKLDKLPYYVRPECLTEIQD